MLEDTLDIPACDGAMETFVVRPDRGGPFPVVFFLMDAPGIREEPRDMARRLATVGYLVLLPNLYYRAGRDSTSSEEHTSELQSLMRISYAGFCLKKKIIIPNGFRIYPDDSLLKADQSRYMVHKLAK